MEGIRLTEGDRAKTYEKENRGPTPNLQCFADLVNAYLSGRGRTKLEAYDACIIMTLAKISRIATGQPGHRDNYVDGATYMAIAFECWDDVFREDEPDTKPIDEVPV